MRERPVAMAMLLLVLTSCGESGDPRARDAGNDANADGGAIGDQDAGSDASTEAGMAPDAGAAPDADVDAGANTTLATLIPQATYEAMFPNRNALYTHAAFLAAAAYYPAFASTGTDEQRRREVAAFLANIAHETTGGWPAAPGGPYAWGLYFTQEVGCESGLCTGYCDAGNVTYPCAPGKTYHGRGPIQLSWNYNYGQVGAVLGLDLLANPELVTSDGTIAFRTAFWFWMTPQSPKPSCHDVMTGGYVPSTGDVSAGRLPGFGLTIDVINGGIECGYAGSASVADRIGFYGRFTSELGVTQGENVDCATMQPY